MNLVLLFAANNTIKTQNTWNEVSSKWHMRAVIHKRRQGVCEEKLTHERIS